VLVESIQLTKFLSQNLLEFSSADIAIADAVEFIVDCQPITLEFESEQLSHGSNDP